MLNLTSISMWEHLKVLKVLAIWRSLTCGQLRCSHYVIQCHTGVSGPVISVLWTYLRSHLVLMVYLITQWTSVSEIRQVAQLWQRDHASSANDFRWGSIRGYYRLRSYFSRHCDMTQFTLTHHMVNKPFLLLLLGLAAEYRSRRRRRWCSQHCSWPSDVYNTDWRTKLTALETISRWLFLKTR